MPPALLAVPSGQPTTEPRDGPACPGEEVTGTVGLGRLRPRHQAPLAAPHTSQLDTLMPCSKRTLKICLHLH